MYKFIFHTSDNDAGQTDLKVVSDKDLLLAVSLLHEKIEFNINNISSSLHFTDCVNYIYGLDNHFIEGLYNVVVSDIVDVGSETWDHSFSHRVDLFHEILEDFDFLRSSFLKHWKSFFDLLFNDSNQLLHNEQSRIMIFFSMIKLYTKLIKYIHLDFGSLAIIYDLIIFVIIKLKSSSIPQSCVRKTLRLIENFVFRQEFIKILQSHSQVNNHANDVTHRFLQKTLCLLTTGETEDDKIASGLNFNVITDNFIKNSTGLNLDGNYVHIISYKWIKSLLLRSSNYDFFIGSGNVKSSIKDDSCEKIDSTSLRKLILIILQCCYIVLNVNSMCKLDYSVNKSNATTTVTTTNKKDVVDDDNNDDGDDVNNIVDGAAEVCSNGEYLCTGKPELLALFKSSVSFVASLVGTFHCKLEINQERIETTTNETTTTTFAAATTSATSATTTSSTASTTPASTTSTARTSITAITSATTTTLTAATNATTVTTNTTTTNSESSGNDNAKNPTTNFSTIKRFHHYKMMIDIFEEHDESLVRMLMCTMHIHQQHYMLIKNTQESSVSDNTNLPNLKNTTESLMSDNTNLPSFKCIPEKTMSDNSNLPNLKNTPESLTMSDNRNLLNPFLLLLCLLQSLDWRHSVLLDWLVSPETCFLEYLVKVFKFVICNFHVWVESCDVFDDDVCKSGRNSMSLLLHLNSSSSSSSSSSDINHILRRDGYVGIATKKCGSLGDVKSNKCRRSSNTKNSSNNSNDDGGVNGRNDGGSRQTLNLTAYSDSDNDEDDENENNLHENNINTVNININNNNNNNNVIKEENSIRDMIDVICEYDDEYEDDVNVDDDENDDEENDDDQSNDDDDDDDNEGDNDETNKEMMNDAMISNDIIKTQEKCEILFRRLLRSIEKLHKHGNIPYDPKALITLLRNFLLLKNQN
ncbi:hypothetical protein HELRODRAFT_174891 [Helobdella robusta]|uniref:Protein Lines N-terminal domain-containing protein n=1 Tax=Helobdella robusta TaxID=6412 RepID=T1F8K9_HELRO|nr:hypothetical protein HELRODRAFT_174891 [Helobdella robusta]ESO01336.1 hypothetical protein HELRODRAFT_174891 [Helobdella robusta]